MPILLFSIAWILLLNACGTDRPARLNGEFRIDPVAVHVLESRPQVEVSGAFQFHVLITNTTYPTCTWSVNGVVGGNEVIGTVTNEGLYRAPASVPTPNIVTVTATATADTTKSDDAIVTIQSKPAISRSWSNIQPKPIQSSPVNRKFLPFHFHICQSLFASLHDRREELNHLLRSARKKT